MNSKMRDGFFAFLTIFSISSGLLIGAETQHELDVDLFDRNRNELDFSPYDFDNNNNYRADPGYYDNQDQGKFPPGQRRGQSPYYNDYSDSYNNSYYYEGGDYNYPQ